MSNQLQPGNYMKVQSVNEFIDKHFSKTYSNTINEKCTKHQGKTGEYYNTADLKQLVTPFVFQELECEVITRMILSDSEKQSYYKNELSYDEIAKR